MAQDPNNLIWIDIEMSGLEPETDRILELAVLITNSQLELVAEGPVLVVHQPQSVLDAMDDWNKAAHGKSGLIDRVKASTLSEAEAERQLLAFVSEHVPRRISPICGNSVHQDRRFLVKYMPKLEEYFLFDMEHHWHLINHLVFLGQSLLFELHFHQKHQKYQHV